MAYEPFSVEIDTEDMPTQDLIVEEVTLYNDAPGWMVTCAGQEIYVPCLPVLDSGQVLRAGIEPRKGDRLRIYGEHGMAIEDYVIFYWTQAQRQDRNRWDLVLSRARAERLFAVRRKSMDTLYEQLPETLQALIDDERAVDAEFRVRFEFGVLAVMKGAMEIAELCREHNPADPMQAWNDMLTEGGKESRDVENARTQIEAGGLQQVLEEVDLLPLMYFTRELLRAKETDV